jgi:hypothetical protein
MIRKHILIFAVVSSFAFAPPSHAILYGVSDGNPGVLYRINEASGLATLIAPVVPGNVSLTGASFLGGQLYGTDVFGSANTMGTIDTATGAFNPTISQGFSLNWHGLASDESAGLLYTIDIDDGNKLKSITSGGVVTTIGAGTGIDGRGMAYDGVNDILYATRSFDSGLYTVDTTTGTAQFIGSMGLNTNRIGLAYDEDTQTLYANEGDSTYSLYTIDVTTGAATLVGPNFAILINGLAWAPSIPEPTTFAIVAIGAAASVGLGRRRRRF